MGDYDDEVFWEKDGWVMDVLNNLPGTVKLMMGAEMCAYTTFRLGGRCRALVDCPDAQSLTEVAGMLYAAGGDYLVIGQGSNLLVSDTGLDCVVLRYCAETPPELICQGDCVTVPGNMLLDDLAHLTITAGLGDLAFCSGIPGTVGGAIAGNAGAFGRQIGDVVASVDLLDCRGGRRTIMADALGFAYRSSVLKETGGVVLSANLRLAKMDVPPLESERERILQLRRSKHPDWRKAPCAGSVFRNIEPTSAAERRQAAGWFLEEAGAMGFRVGGARLFEKHANIIIADEGATAHDVFELTEKMIAAVEARFGFKLEREIRLLGDFGGITWQN